MIYSNRHSVPSLAAGQCTIHLCHLAPMDGRIPPSRVGDADCYKACNEGVYDRNIYSHKSAKAGLAKPKKKKVCVCVSECVYECMYV